MSWRFSGGKYCAPCGRPAPLAAHNEARLLVDGIDGRRVLLRALIQPGRVKLRLMAQGTQAASISSPHISEQSRS